jgi:hypothetical protein
MHFGSAYCSVLRNKAAPWAPVIEKSIVFFLPKSYHHSADTHPWSYALSLLSLLTFTFEMIKIIFWKQMGRSARINLRYQFKSRSSDYGS